MVLAVWAPDSVLFAARVRSGDGGSSYEALMRNLEKYADAHHFTGVHA
jgi:hypothetical protein